MNPYELLDTLQKEIARKYFSNIIPAPINPETKTITIAEHLREINRIFAALRGALDTARYEFEFLDNKGKIVHIGDNDVNLKVLEEHNTIIFQPLSLLSESLEDVDFESLQEGMMQLAESTKANVIMLPPSINVMSVKLKKDTNDIDSTEQTGEDPTEV